MTMNHRCWGLQMYPPLLLLTVPLAISHTEPVAASGQAFLHPYHVHERPDVFSSIAEMEALFKFESKLDLALAKNATQANGRFIHATYNNNKMDKDNEHSSNASLLHGGNDQDNAPHAFCDDKQQATNRRNFAAKDITEPADRWEPFNSLDGSMDFSRRAANPLDSFAILKRLAVDVRPLQEILTSSDPALNDSVSALTKHLWDAAAETGVKLPLSLVDLSGAATALVRLRETYRLSIGDMFYGRLVAETSQGNLKLIAAGHPLSARDFMFIGKHAFNKNSFGEAFDWLSSALKFASLESPNTTSVVEILPLLRTTEKIHDDTLAKRGPVGPHWKTNPYFVSDAAKKAHNSSVPQLDQLKPTLRRKWDTVLNPKLFQPFQEDYEEEIVFQRLCRGEVFQSEEQRSKLKCRLVHNGNPYMKLGPAKLEEMSVEPYIVVLHDFMPDSLSERLKELAQTAGMMRSRHMDKKHEMVSSSKRTSKQVWLHNGADPLLDKVSSRIEAVTGLNTRDWDAAEPYQVANYGIGGNYMPHADYIDFKKDLHGRAPSPMHHVIKSRMATFMVYLSDVAAGGATAFPVAGVAVTPKKGAAVLWWNLDSSLQGDAWTRHGGCPVLIGSKWIANKWIRSQAQMFKLPCLPKTTRIRQP